MHNRQYILRRTRAAIVALVSLATFSALATPASAAGSTSGPQANSLSAAASTHASTDAAWTTVPVQFTEVSTGAGQHGPIGLQTICTVSLSPPFLMGNGNVGVDWSVVCDGQVRMIQGIVGILTSSGAALGNTVDQFTIFGLGGGNLIQRPCAAGTLNGAMRVRVTFLSGTPLVIEGLFFGPALPISC